LNSSITHNGEHHINDRTTVSGSLKKMKGLFTIMHELNEQELEQVVGGYAHSGAFSGGSVGLGNLESGTTSDIYIWNPWNTEATASSYSLGVGKNVKATSGATAVTA
jgi:bacteriocin-like protein